MSKVETLPPFQKRNVLINREMVAKRREMTFAECMEVGMTPAQKQVFIPCEMEKKITEWLSTFQSKDQPWSLLTTITMRRYDHAFDQPWSITEIDKAICVFVKRLDQKAFPKRYRYEHRRIGRIVARHLGDYQNNPHFHLIVTRPLHLSDAEFRTLITATAKRIHWIEGEPHFEGFRDVGAISYLLSDRAAEIIPEATERAC